MPETSQNTIYYMRYRDIAIQKAREYYAKNKETIKSLKEKNKRT